MAKSTKTSSAKTARSAPQVFSVNAGVSRILCDYLTGLEYPKEKLEELVGMSLEDLTKDESRVDLSCYHELWLEAVHYQSKADLAFEIARDNASEGMGLLGHIFFNCRTLESAIQHYIRYYALVNEGIEVDVEVAQGNAILHHRLREGVPYCAYEMEYTIALAAERARRLLQSGLDVEYVMFQHPEPEHAKDYQEFFRCPIRFDQPDTGIAFKADYLSFEMPRNSPSLYKILSHHLDSLMSKVSLRAKVSKQVMSIVRNKISKQDLDADYVAKRLNMSRNTMYRHLKKEGHSYHEIVDKVRSDYAIECLRSGKYNVTEVAFILGFSELSAFSRAFKRWTGLTPNNFMKGEGG